MTPVPLPQTNGTFWLADGVGEQMAGFLEPTDDGTQATLSGVVPDDPTITVERSGSGIKIAHHADPELHVRAFAARDIHGVLDSGVRWSLIGANNHGGSGHQTYPEFRTRVAIEGAHVTATQTYLAMKIRLDQSWWLDHLSDGDSAEVSDDQSMLSVSSEGDQTWLVYESAVPLRIDQVTRRVISACRSLAWLVLDVHLLVLETRVRIDRVSPWLSVHGEQYSRDKGADRTAWLLDPSFLTTKRFAAWIAMHHKFDGLDSAVQELDGGGPVQVRALLGATLIEGFHRRLEDFEQSKFPGVSKGRLKAVRSAASDHARRAAEQDGGLDADLVEESVRQGVSFFADVSYQSRIDDVILQIADVVPELTESVPSLAVLIKHARNDLAHHLQKRDGQRDAVFLRWTTAAHVLPWMLRPFLLTLADFDHRVLHNAIGQHVRYQYACANARAFVRELEQLTST